MRDYSTWAFGNLPGKADGSDFDRVVERRGNFLMWEFKPNTYVPKGQRILFDAITAQPNWTLYLAVDRYAHKGIVQVGRWVSGEGVKTWWTMTPEQCAELETMWYEEVEYYAKRS